MAGHVYKEGTDGRRALVVGPEAGRRIDIPGVAEVTTVKVAGADTGDRISFHEEWHGLDDSGVPRHVHRHLDEIFYVLEGEMRFLLGEDECVAGRGTTVYVPSGTVHAWRPTGTVPVRQLLVVVSGGFEDYLNEMQTLLPPQEAREQWQDFNQRWDVEVVGPVLDPAVNS